VTQTDARKIGALSLVLLLLLFPLVATLANPYTVSVSTSSPTYTPGDTVTVNVKITPPDNVIIGWELYDPNGARKDFGQVSCNSGSCSFSFKTGTNWPTGTYTVIVAVSGTSDKGSTTFTLKTAPPPPTPPPTPPPPVNYEPLARSQIMSDKDALASLNSTIRTLQTLLTQLNQTLSIDYLKQLSQIAQQIQAAENLYSQGQYEQAYNTATAASDALSKLATSLARETINILGTTANTLYARTTDPTVRDLLQAVISTLSSLSPYDTQVFDRLFFITRTLAVVAKTLNIPALQSSLSSLSTQLQNLQSRLTSLNQTKAQLEQQVATLQQQNQNLQQQVSSLQTQVNSLQSQISQLQQQVSTLQTENANLKAQLEQTMPTTTAIAAAILALIAGLAIGIVVARLLRKQ
jgi:regulator of replication initiation timing